MKPIDGIENTPAPDKGMSLYRIDETLDQLITLREEMVQDDPPATPDDLAVVDQQIREYLLVELPRKVASTCAIFRKWKGERALNKAERDRLARLDRALEEREERLKAYVAEILERQPMPAKGCRKLEAADGSKLMLKGNGGVQPLNVDLVLLPEEYLDVTVRMPASMWNTIVEQCTDVTMMQLATEPSNARIREALARQCDRCEGVGHFVYRSPAEMSVEALQAGAAAEKVYCAACGGTGKQGVPGASLGERGAHVEVK